MVYFNDFPAYKSVAGMLGRCRSTRSSKPDGSLESNAGIMVYFNDFPAYKSVVGMLGRCRSTRSSKQDGSLESNAGS